MEWIVALISMIVVPIVQPVVQTGVQRMQAQIVQRQQPQPYVVFHEGRWWKYEGGQWYYWVPAQEIRQ